MAQSCETCPLQKRSMFKELTRDEIRQQYDLYNKNIGGLQEEVDILGGLLDSIETPVAPAASDEPSDE